MIGRIRVDEFVISSSHDKDIYEEILNSKQCRIMEEKNHIDKDGSVVVFLKYLDQRPEDDKADD